MRMPMLVMVRNSLERVATPPGHEPLNEESGQSGFPSGVTGSAR